MKVLENITIFRCDYCFKEMKRKHSMVNHELICDKNPNNQKACHFCKNLEVIEKEVFFENPYYHPDYNDDDGEWKSVKVFRCILFDKLMYPYSIEKRGLPNKYPDTFDEQEPMPIVCESFESISNEIF